MRCATSIATIVETNLSLRDYRQNQVMKKVTSWAAIIAVPTLITGWYGMNVPYPGFAQQWGVWLAAALMFVLSGGLYVSSAARTGSASTSRAPPGRLTLLHGPE